MQCPRCNSVIQKISEYFIDDKYKEEYFCTFCNSSLIETFKQSGFHTTEWIDFNA